MTQLAYLILTGDHSLSVPPSISMEEVITSTSATSTPHSQHRRSSSRGSVRGFIPPEETLVASLTPPIAQARSHSVRPLAVQPQPMMVRHQQHGEALEANGGSSSNEGSSTESQSHMKVSSDALMSSLVSYSVHTLFLRNCLAHALDQGWVGTCTCMWG